MMRFGFWFLYRASPQQGDLRLSGPPSGQGAHGRARIRDRRIPADLRADSLSTVPPMPLTMMKASPQQGDLRLSGPPSGQGAHGRARIRDRRIPADLRADSLSTVPPMPLTMMKTVDKQLISVNFVMNEDEKEEIIFTSKRHSPTETPVEQRFQQEYEREADEAPLSEDGGLEDVT
ncbi:hypothetical protein PoB_002743400 [Plakobranchus ocellatus]|uniref:Uncharacterized protein n=1 Tax=Plakobranchus ocellatus TaxID=259542 RepID=A0AAV4A420_9GAST|nr:hypothetical protein PoB_002743400 [Plakobranchus ocellatus]